MNETAKRGSARETATPPRLGLVAGGILGALAVAAGAFGAHGLRERLTPDALALWETAARYLMYAGLALVGVGAARRGHGGVGGRSSAPRAETALLVGAVVFSGTLFALALGAPRWFGAVTPLGGVGLIAGFVLLAWTAWRG